MKGYIKHLLREGLLTEKLIDIDSDVDFIYDKIFKSDIDKIQELGIINGSMFKDHYRLDTSMLTSELCEKANNINPCSIIFNNGRNYYKPSANEISISVHTGAVNLIIDNGGNLYDTDSYLNDEQSRKIKFEFTEAKIKGSIHHELVHWIDDTLNNRHVSKSLTKASELSNKSDRVFKGPVNASKLEIQAQIHNIKQLHNKYKDMWDDLTFDDMISYSPPLTSIMNGLNGDVKSKWVRAIKTRMYREGLLGKKMYN